MGHQRVGRKRGPPLGSKQAAGLQLPVAGSDLSL